MQISKPHYCSICKISIKLFPLLICCLLLVCCQQKNTKQVLSAQNQTILSESAININSASAEELEKLPHIGARIALRIVEYREKYGRFRKPEHLLLVDGVSNEHFREMRNFIKVE